MLGLEHNLLDILVGEVVWLGRTVADGNVRQGLMELTPVGSSQRQPGQAGVADGSLAGRR